MLNKAVIPFLNGIDKFNNYRSMQDGTLPVKHSKLSNTAHYDNQIFVLDAK